MEQNSENDSDFESADEGSEYFSVADREETQFQQLDWNGDSDYSDELSEDTPTKASSSRHPSRRSNRIITKRRK